MQTLFQDIQCELEAGATLAMATLVRRKGSVPREIGAKMLVHRDGRISGTVGGGCGEAEVWRGALNVIDTGRPRTVQISLTEEIALESEGVCGGIFDVFIQPWHAAPAAGKPSMLDMARAIARALAEEQAVALVTLIAASGPWRHALGQQVLYYENGATLGTLSLPDAPPALTAQLIQAAQSSLHQENPHIEKINGSDPATWAEVFVEPFIPAPVLLIAGAGHIAAPLAELGALMKFSVSVTDDRASFARRERFPTAKHLLVGSIEETLRAYPITPRTYIVLVTRAHSHDVQALRAILDSSAAYIGMIGSQRRVWAVLKLLHAEGMPEEKLLRVRAPIGLDLGGSTPEEIALSIMSEVVLVRRGGTSRPLSNALRERYRRRLQDLDNMEVEEE